jgi:hypothetical protein
MLDYMNRNITSSPALGLRYFLHRDPDLWPDPDQLKPERFLEPTHTHTHRTHTYHSVSDPESVVERDFHYK